MMDQDVDRFLKTETDRLQSTENHVTIMISIVIGIIFIILIYVLLKIGGTYGAAMGDAGYWSGAQAGGPWQSTDSGPIKNVGVAARALAVTMCIVAIAVSGLCIVFLIRLRAAFVWATDETQKLLTNSFEDADRQMRWDSDLK